jgi:rRNA-processing protein FCF1
MLILMDTNACIYVIKNRVDLLESLENALEVKAEIAVLSECVLEAKRLGLAERKAFDRFVESFKPRIVQGGRKSVDGAILNYSSKTDCIVCTGDAALVKKLRGKGIRVLLFRKGGKLELS